MRDLPHRAQQYIAAVIIVAAFSGLAAILALPVRLERAPMAAVLLVGAILAQQFRVKSPKHQSYHPTTIFYFAAALMLRPAFVIAIIIAAHVVELLRVRYRWYISVFNVANFVLSSLAASALFSLGSGGPAVSGPGTAIAAVIAGLVFVSLNHLLTALVVMWARGVSLGKSGTLHWENLGTDLALMSVGALGALLWMTNALLVPLTLGPLFLIYRSLLVPSLKEEANTDPKTGLANMKHWNQLAEAELLRARRFRRPLSVVLADLDLLRDVNNAHGHLVGDQMIRLVADAMRGALREYDVPARFGGDEFAILMPETTLSEAIGVGERVRRAVETIELKTAAGERVAVSLSVGVAVYPQNGQSAAELLAVADRAVYQAKALGRNRVCAFGDANETLRGLTLNLAH